MSSVILVIGDDPTACATLVDALAAGGHPATGVLGQEEAADALRGAGFQPSMIVVDVARSTLAWRIVHDVRWASAASRAPILILTGARLDPRVLPPAVVAVLPRTYQTERLLKVVAGLTSGLGLDRGARTADAAAQASALRRHGTAAALRSRHRNCAS